MSSESTPTNSARRKQLIGLVKWTLFLLVIFFVAREAVEIWLSGQFSQIEVDWRWLLLAGVCYFAGWLPAVWFWRSYLVSTGCHPDWLATLRAYYCGHLGKYVPGKATVLVIRAGLLRDQNVPIKVAAVGATLESLGVMGVGLGITLALAAWVLPGPAWDVIPTWLHCFESNKWLGPVTVLVVAGVSIPVLASFLKRIASRLAQREVDSVPSLASASDEQAPQSDGDPADVAEAGVGDSGSIVRLLVVGSLSFIPAWFLHGLSLGCVVIATGGAASAADSVMWMGVVAGATSIGFLVLIAPGGLGIREALIVAALAPGLGKPLAIAIAAILRITWFVTELVTAGLLYFIRKR